MFDVLAQVAQPVARHRHLLVRARLHSLRREKLALLSRKVLRHPVRIASEASWLHFRDPDVLDQPRDPLVFLICILNLLLKTSSFLVATIKLYFESLYLLHVGLVGLPKLNVGL